MLNNTLYRLFNGGDLRVAYFGGSITEGAGASAYEQCWAAKTTAWLKSVYPRCRIRHVQAAIGGTDSTLGVFRCDRDVCAQKPDLIFYEFAVNDSGLDYLTALKNTEGCFRKIWTADPYADIVTVYTVTKALADRAAKGFIQAAKQAHGAVSQHYQVPQIDIGESLKHRVLSEGTAAAKDADWLRYTTDTVHPNDAGYALYAATVQEHLNALFAEAGQPEGLLPKHLPVPMVSEEQSHLRARIVDCMQAEMGVGWSVKEESLCLRYPHYIECSTPGALLQFRFHGSRLDLYWMMAKDSGDALCSVDGEEEIRLSSWDSYCKRFDRANAACVARDLPEGEHTLSLRLADMPDPGSEGNVLRIGAFLVL